MEKLYFFKHLSVTDTHTHKIHIPSRKPKGKRCTHQCCFTLHFEPSIWVVTCVAGTHVCRHTKVTHRDLQMDKAAHYNAKHTKPQKTIIARPVGLRNHEKQNIGKLSLQSLQENIVQHVVTPCTYYRKPFVKSHDQLPRTTECCELPATRIMNPRNGNELPHVPTWLIATNKATSVHVGKFDKSHTFHAAYISIDVISKNHNKVQYKSTKAQWTMMRWYTLTDKLPKLNVTKILMYFRALSKYPHFFSARQRDGCFLQKQHDNSRRDHTCTV